MRAMKIAPKTKPGKKISYRASVRNPIAKNCCEDVDGKR
jgi:hypothetical protein